MEAKPLAISSDVTLDDGEIEQIYEQFNTPRPIMVVVSGPSGVGKDAIIQELQKINHPFHFVVTATTRPKRPNEVDGVDYHFVSEGEFADMIERDELLEYAVVYGDYKGIPKQQVRDALASSKDVILRIDVQGAATIRKLVPNAVTIFLNAESEDELIRRLRDRKTETEGKLKMRIVTARQELKRMDEFDYAVVNRLNRQDQTAQLVLSIIYAEKSRVDWNPIKL
ncbi:MAG: guanylate kinase [Chloroflexota bacterium]